MRPVQKNKFTKILAQTGDLWPVTFVHRFTAKTNENLIVINSKSYFVYFSSAAVGIFCVNLLASSSTEKLFNVVVASAEW